MAKTIAQHIVVVFGHGYEFGAIPDARTVILGDDRNEMGSRLLCVSLHRLESRYAYCSRDRCTCRGFPCTLRRERALLVLYSPLPLGCSLAGKGVRGGNEMGCVKQRVWGVGCLYFSRG